MDFQAVIFCGKGKRLTPFTLVRPKGMPKAMLPIANRPMVHYALQWCDSAPFYSVLVVTDSESHQTVSLYVTEYSASRDPELSLKIEVYATDIEGTGAILKHLYDLGRLTKESVTLPCDFVSDFPAQILVHEYRNRSDNDLAMCVYSTDAAAVDSKKAKTLLTLYSKEGNVLLDTHTYAQVRRLKALSIPSQMVWRHPDVRVSAVLADSHVYFWLTKAFKCLDAEHYNFEGILCARVARDLARRSWRHTEERETVKIFVLPQECDFIRADTLPTYLEANRYVMQSEHSETMQKIQQGLLPALLGKKEKGAPVIGPESKIGADTTLGDKTNVKKSFIGNGCKIGTLCKISGSVLLDNVVLEDDVVLENCIIGKGAKLESKCRLVNCEVEHGNTVFKGNSLKGETLLHETFEDGFEVQAAEESEDEEDEEQEEEEEEEGSE